MRLRHRRIRDANGGDDRLFALLISHMQVSALPAATNLWATKVGVRYIDKSGPLKSSVNAALRPDRSP